MSENQTKVHVVGIALVRDDSCLVAQRPEGGSFGLRWEFPGGKIEPGESPSAALMRELKEEMDVEVSVGEFVERGEANVGTKRIVLDVYFGTIVKGEPRALEHRELKWCSADELAGLNWADADVPIAPIVQNRLRKGVV